MDKDKVLEALERLLNEPQSGSVDGVNFRNHSIKDLIDLDRYVAAKRGKIRTIQFTPPSGDGSM